MMLLFIIPLLLLAGCRSGKKSLPEGFDLQGHRGAMGLKPENTLPGFFKAVELGVNTIEFDIAVSKEHKIVVSHEPWFRSDICLQPDGSSIPEDEERSFRLYEYDYETISRFDCGSLQHPDHPNQKTLFAAKPLMSEAIIAIDEYVRSKNLPPMRYNIEIKSHSAWDNTLTPAPDVFARLLHEELLILDSNENNGLLKRINVQSFDPRVLHSFREIAPSIPIAILTYTEAGVNQHIEEFGFLPEIYSPQYGIVTREHVVRAHELGMRVIPWTVNRKVDMEKIVAMGVDGLITDYPNRFNELFPDRETGFAVR